MAEGIDPTVVPGRILVGQAGAWVIGHREWLLAGWDADGGWDAEFHPLEGSPQFATRDEAQAEADRRNGDQP